MKYYKIINSDRQVVDALIDKEISYVKYQQRNKLLVNCAKDEAQGFLSYDLLNVYRTDDMTKFPSSCNYQYEEVTLKEITEDDYNILRKAIDKNKHIEPDPEPEKPDEPEIDDNILELVKTGSTTLPYHADVESLNTIEEISNITYGMDIPEEYQSDVLKAIIAKNEVN